MTAKEYLQQYQVLKAEAVKEKAIYDELLDLLSLGAVDYSGIKVQTSYHDTYAEVFARAEEHLTALRGHITASITKRDEIICTVEKIGSESLKAVLILRYIQGKSLDKIGEDLGKSRRTIDRLHGKALKEIEQYISE